MIINFRQFEGKKKHIDGVRKTIFDGPNNGTYVMHFKDNIYQDTLVAGKGVINNRISELLFSRLKEVGIANHFVKRLNMREQLIQRVEPIPFKVVIYNAIIDELADRLSVEESFNLCQTIPEFILNTPKKSSINEYHILAMDWASEEELDSIKIISRRINDFLSGQFLAIGMRLLSISLEFGRIYHDDISQLLLIDEISPDTCSLLEVKSQERLDKTMATKQKMHAEQGYQEVAKRLGILMDE